MSVCGLANLFAGSSCTERTVCFRYSVSIQFENYSRNGLDKNCSLIGRFREGTALDFPPGTKHLDSPA